MPVLWLLSKRWKSTWSSKACNITVYLPSHISSIQQFQPWALEFWLNSKRITISHRKSSPALNLGRLFQHCCFQCHDLELMMVMTLSYPSSTLFSKQKITVPGRLKVCRSVGLSSWLQTIYSIKFRLPNIHQRAPWLGYKLIRFNIRSNAGIKLDRVVPAVTFTDHKPLFSQWNIQCHNLLCCNEKGRKLDRC